MIDTILFDLDGTLLRCSQAAFVDAYFKEIRKAFEKLGMDGALSMKAIWAGTKAMLTNDGSALNKERFWKAFAEVTRIDENMLQRAKEMSDDFYVNEFNRVKSVAEPSDVPARLIPAMIAKGYAMVLATNPLFPPAGITTRLGWIGLSPQDFILVTHYENSSFCKPNPGYYQEIFAKINKQPEQCIMVGNNVSEDMCAEALGTKAFLVTGYVENESGADTSAFPQGALADLERYLLSFPDISI
ncbi:MAG: HAD family hydrolase [Defluviitaleaceae bacterium]|nr:HAD family hydrolase [Defluviitaleaceae bacterium]MCL2240451.1 HAD family hydrolase [Defluviitaleaceae bacterium]